MEEELNEGMLQRKAIEAALAAYSKVFEDEDIDVSYFPILKIVYGKTDMNMTQILEKNIYIDQSFNGKDMSD